MNGIRILLVDDNELAACAVETMLRLHTHLDVVATVHNGVTAVELARQQQPDVIVMDVQMPGLDGIEATQELRRQQVTAPVVILTSDFSRALVRLAFESGATAFVLKDQVAAELVPAIHAVHQGQRFVSAAIRERLGSHLSFDDLQA